MKTNHTEPFIPRKEIAGETLARLSANISTLTGIIDEAESRGRLSLARLFTEERAAKVVEVREMIAQVRARLAAPLAPGGQHQVIRGPVGNLPLQPEVKQWQRAVNEGWKQKL